MYLPRCATHTIMNSRLLINHYPQKKTLYILSVTAPPPISPRPKYYYFKLCLFRHFIYRIIQYIISCDWLLLLASMFIYFVALSVFHSFFFIIFNGRDISFYSHDLTSDFNNRTLSYNPKFAPSSHFSSPVSRMLSLGQRKDRTLIPPCP